MTEGRSPHAWKTGTSEASWALRKDGRYEEAWQLVSSRALPMDESKDAEALMEMVLCYPNMVASNRAYRRAAAALGHPLAMAYLYLYGHEYGEPVPEAILESDHELAKLIFRDCTEPPDRMFGEDSVPRAVKQDPAHTLYYFGEASPGNDGIGADLLAQAALVWHHPLAASRFLDILDNRKRSDPPLGVDESEILRQTAIHCLRIGALQRHAYAAAHLANCHFGVDWHGFALLPSERNLLQGAHLLSYFQPVSVSLDFHVILLDRLAKAPLLPLSVERAQELYVYGKANTPYMQDNWVGTKEHGTPRDIYTKVIRLCRAASVITMVHAWRRYRVPRDVCVMLGRMIWDTRAPRADAWCFAGDEGNEDQGSAKKQKQ
jgi:hypothetical protein